MACGCGKSSGGVKVAPTPVYYVESDPEGVDTSIYIQSTIRINTQTFNRVFQQGTIVIVPESYANELSSLDAPILIR